MSKKLLLMLLSVSIFTSFGIANAGNILPGWTMFFFSLEPTKRLCLLVVQTAPNQNEDQALAGINLANAVGSGSFIIEGKIIKLYVKQASWKDDSELNPDNNPKGTWDAIMNGKKFPESAFVRGKAYIDSIEEDFTIKLLSYEFPSFPLKEPIIYDQAILAINNTTEIVKGELHHSIINAYLSPPQDSLITRSGERALTWGKLKKGE